MMEDHTDGGAYPEKNFKDQTCYVIQTKTGDEDTVIALMNVLAKGFFFEAFLPKRVMTKKVRGKIKKVTQNIFHGYIFVTTSCPTELFLKLKRVPKLSTLLCDGEYNFYRLSDDETQFIMRIGENRGDHIFGLSLVELNKDVPYKSGDRVRIISGDLKGFEGEIAYFDIHHRKAAVKTSLFGGTVIHVGIELLVKDEKEQLMLNKPLFSDPLTVMKKNRL